MAEQVSDMQRNGVILFCGHAFKVRVARCVSPAPRELRWLSAKNNDDTIQIDGARVYYQQFADREAVLGTCEYNGALVELLTLWKDADPDIPVFMQAKSEYAKLQ